MGWEVVALAAVSAVGTAISARAEGKAHEAQAAFEEEQFAQQGRQSLLQAQDEENQRRKELGMLLGTQKAQAASSGVSVGSMSFSAIQTADRQVAQRDIANIQLLGAARASQAKLSGDAARSKKKYFGGVASSAWLTGAFAGAKTGLSAYAAMGGGPRDGPAKQTGNRTYDQGDPGS